jgi:zinc resistance-associated protein
MMFLEFLEITSGNFPGKLNGGTKMNRGTKAIMVLTVVAIFGITTMAFAGWGRGPGQMMGPEGRGPGWHQRGGCAYGQGNLSEEEFAKLEEQRAQFFAATEDIRQKLYEKELALQSELVKENPDRAVAMELQSEISQLQADLDQKRLDYDIQIGKLMPNYKRGFMGHAMMTGRGCGGGGYCMR